MIVNDLDTGKGIVRWRESGDPDAPITAIWHHGTPGIAGLAPANDALACVEVVDNHGPTLRRPPFGHGGTR
ncbi:MAG TPA: hypothetical protein VFC06_03225, partial [Demequina sp.]|nr:hypothetical protein [Demequina sp.]